MRAKNGLATRRKKVVIRHSKTKDYLVAIKNYGVEPELQFGAGTFDFVGAFNWYNHVCTESNARTFLNEYLKTSGREVDVQRLMQIPDTRLPTTAAWIARMLVKYPHLLPASFKETFERGLQKAYSYVTDDDPANDDAPKKPSVRDRMRDKASDIAAELYGMIDDEAYDTNVFDWLKAQNVSSTYVPGLIRKFQPLLEETVAALRGGSADVKEAYRHIEKSETHALAEFLISMIKDMKRYGEANKTVRKARKPRVVSIEKKLKSFKYQAESSEYKLASINPAIVVGTQDLWTFDTRYGTLTHFKALDRVGLDIKGTTIIGFDPKESVSKKTGRKSQKIVEYVLSAGKNALRTMLVELKNTKLQERVNDHIVLLRAY